MSEPSREDVLAIMDDAERAYWDSGAGTPDERGRFWKLLEQEWRSIPDATDSELQQVMTPHDWEHVQRGENRDGILNFYRRKWKRDRRKPNAERSQPVAEDAQDDEPPQREGIEVIEGANSDETMVRIATDKQVSDMQKADERFRSFVDEGLHQTRFDGTFKDIPIQPQSDIPAGEFRDIQPEESRKVAEMDVPTPDKWMPRYEGYDPATRRVLSVPIQPVRPEQSAEIVADLSDTMQKPSWQDRLVDWLVRTKTPRRAGETFPDKFDRLSESNLFWGGGVGIVTVGLGFRFAGAPHWFSIALLIVGWLIISISIWRHKFFEGYTRLIQVGANTFVCVAIGILIGGAWMALAPPTQQPIQKSDTVQVIPQPTVSPIEFRPAPVISPSPSPQTSASPTASTAATPTPSEPSPPKASELNPYQGFRAHKAVPNVERTFVIRPTPLVRFDVPVKIDIEWYWPEIAGKPLVAYVSEANLVGQEVSACAGLVIQFKEIRQEMQEVLQQSGANKNNIGIANALIIYHAGAFTKDQVSQIQAEARYHHLEIVLLGPKR